MKYCLCKENWDYCKCEKHRCPKHDKITKRPVPPVINYDLSTDNGTATINFAKDFTVDTTDLGKLS